MTSAPARPRADFPPHDPAWVADNHVRLGDALGDVLDRLHAAAQRDAGTPAPTPAGPVDEPDVPALTWLGLRLGLSEFEQNVLLLAAAPELLAGVGRACAAVHGDERRRWPTLGLALALFPGGHWSALTPWRPLRRYRLVTLDGGDHLTEARLRCDERVLHLVAGIASDDEVLTPYVDVEPTRADDLPGAQRRLTERVVARWASGTDHSVQLCGADADQRRAVVHGIASGLEAAAVVRVDPLELPAEPVVAHDLLCRVEREARLRDAVVLLDPGDRGIDDEARARLRRALRDLTVPLVLSVQRREPLDQRCPAHEVAPPPFDERRRMWEEALAGVAGPGEVDRLAAGFVLTREVIDSVVAADAADPWQACRSHLRSDIGGTVRVRQPEVPWERLVLPEDCLARLRAIVREARHRAVVNERWGMSGVGGRGGVAALFSGPSGTGKTLAAEVVATELRVDLLHVDLSQVVNKYIGETEKNLARVFDAGERSGAVLLFDEADALFGKRTDIKDSHDRYANIEVSYLLQRMEAYTGVALLTTNLRANLDQAFVRRLRFLIEFPHPGPHERERIWDTVFGELVPLDTLDLAALARLDVTGGVIANIAKGAAFRAADIGGPVTMSHLAASAADEYRKLERPLTTGERWS